MRPGLYDFTREGRERLLAEGKSDKEIAGVFCCI